MKLFKTTLLTLLLLTFKVSAGLKSYTEAVQRLEAGEVFYQNTKKIYLDTNLDNPFRMEHVGQVGTNWSCYPEWQVKVETPWYEEEDTFQDFVKYLE